MNRNPFSRRKSAVVIAAAGLTATALAAIPASATLSGPGVAEGRNITVFHNIDFIAAFGWTLGEELTVTVARNGVTIGTSTGPAVDTPEGPGLEVNQGPEGAPVAGDCWVGQTPDVRPGDVVTVTNGTETDQVTVDNFAFTGRPREAGNGDILVPFLAKRANGNVIPADFIDSAEFRAATNNQVRFEGNRVVVQRQPGGRPGEYQMRYRAPFRPSRNDDENPFNQTQLRRALLGDGHAVGFGHVAPLPRESMLLDGLDDAPGPAPGCEGAPSAQWKVSAVAPGSVNLRNRANGLTVRGLAHDAESVSVALSDSDPTTSGAPTGTVNLAGAGRQQWNVPFTARQLRGLDGRIRVAATFVLADGQFADRSVTVLKDLVAPKAPRVSLAAGSYNRTKRVALRSAPNNQIRYTLGDTRPTRNSGTVFRPGRRIRISSTQTLKAIAIDPAGNVSELGKWRYRIR
jgi:hypothetical protein